MIKRLLFLIIISIIFISASHKSSNNVLSLNARNWITISEPQPYPKSNVNGWLALPFKPNIVDSNGITETLNYLYTQSVPRNITSKTLIITVSTTALVVPVIFNFMTESFNTCTGQPANARPFLHAHNDDWSSNTARWWSSESYDLASFSPTILTIPLTPNLWSDVIGEYGTAQLNSFNSALSDISSLGLTFGGGCFYGHGVNLTSGQANFNLESYVIQ